jgi:hypothetical protein
MLICISSAWANVIVAAITAGVLVWTLIWVRQYTLAAREQARAAFEQAEAAQKPCIVPTVKADGVGVTNVGNGPAINLTYTFARGAAIQKRTGRIVAAKGDEPLDDGKGIAITLERIGSPADGPATFEATYESMSGSTYETKGPLDRTVGEHGPLVFRRLR